MSPSLPLLLSIAQFSSSGAYLLLFLRLLRSGRGEALPLFTLYTLLMTADLAWSPTLIRHLMWIDPWLFALRLCLSVESVLLASVPMGGREQRYTLLSFVCIGTIGALRTVGYFDVRTLSGAYYSMGQYIHIGAAIFCLAAVVHQLLFRWKWDRVWVPHLRLVCAYMGIWAVSSFFHTPGQGWSHHATVRIGKLAALCAWIAVWAWYDRRELRAARFKRVDAIT